MATAGAHEYRASVADGAARDGRDAAARRTRLPTDRASTACALVDGCASGDTQRPLAIVCARTLHAAMAAAAAVTRCDWLIITVDGPNA